MTDTVMMTLAGLFMIALGVVLLGYVGARGGDYSGRHRNG